MEVLVLQREDEKLRVIGTQPAAKPVADSGNITAKASFQTLRLVKFELARGNVVYIGGKQTGTEVVPSNLMIVESQDPLVAAKNLALDDINNLINQNVFGVSVVDSMDYLDCMLKLMSNGIFITDENREDKYFEIIEAAQTTEAPRELTTDSTFEEEQAALEQKRKYDAAQSNLVTLEKYLNAYDKLSKIRFVSNLLNGYKERVLSAKNVQEVEDIVREYCEKLDNFMFSNPCSI